jgi:hypothetical protein
MLVKKINPKRKNHIGIQKMNKKILELIHINKKRLLSTVSNIIGKSIEPLLARVYPGCFIALYSNVNLQTLNLMTTQWGNLPLRSCPIVKK